MRGLLSILLLSLTLCGFAAERVVSLSPNLTETIALLGAENQLVGRSASCDRPASVKRIPVVGGFGAPSLEPLLTVRPTLVVTESLRDPEVIPRFRKLGIRVELFPAARFADYFRNLARLGKLLGREREAKAAAEFARKRLAAWRKANAGLSENARLKVLVVIGTAPVITAGKNSFLTAMIELAGGRNSAANVDRSYFRCSFEQIALWKPDVILAPGLPPERLRNLKKSPGWSDLPAVKNDCVITDFDPDLLYRLGPRSFDGIANLRKILAVLRKRSKASKTHDFLICIPASLTVY